MCKNGNYMQTNCNTVKVFFNCKNTDNNYRVSGWCHQCWRVYVAEGIICLLLGIEQLK